ncbi:aspartic peptidase domain-containing protein [Mycena vitilis]|nr:aspartic peptidase domain-containing protein [Mycena vitilis]
MWCLSLGILLGIAAACTTALSTDGTRLPLHRRDQGGATLQSISNLTFTNAPSSYSLPRLVRRNITVNGQNFRVAIDTGSSDFWGVTALCGRISGKNLPLSSRLVPPKNFTFNNTELYGGDNYGGGMIIGQIGFASVEFGGYKFEEQAFINATTIEFGGIVDIGLDGLLGLSFASASASNIVQKLQGEGLGSGEPFLFDIFDQTPEQDNFIGMALSRNDDLSGTADGSISVNGVNVSVPKSAVDGVPEGKLVALLDSGTPSLGLGKQLFDAIYSQIPGSNYTQIAGMPWWEIPCNTTASVSVQIGGNAFPIHPLDLSQMWPDLVATETTCTGNASIQLLFLTDPTKAAADTLSVRKAQLAAGPLIPNMAPEATDAIHEQPALSDTQQSSGGSLAAAALDTTISNSNSDSQVKKYAPIVIGLLGGNLLATLFVVVIGVALCVKRGGKAVSRSRSRKYAKVRFEDDGEGSEGRPLESYDTDKRYSD